MKSRYSGYMNISTVDSHYLILKYYAIYVCRRPRNRRKRTWWNSTNIKAIRNFVKKRTGNSVPI